MGSPRERIALFRAPFSMARSGAGNGGGRDALKGLARDTAGEAFGRDFVRIPGEPMTERPDPDAMEPRLRDSALSGSAGIHRAVPGTRDAELPAPECPGCGRVMKRRRRKVPKAFLTRVGEVTLRRACHHCRRRRGGKVPPAGFPGLEGTSMSPGAERTVAELAAGVPVRGARGLPRELSGLSAGRSRLWERAAGPGGEAERCGREEVAPVAGARPDRIHAPVDGTGVPMRGDAPGGRAGKGEDGRAGERHAVGGDRRRGRSRARHVRLRGASPARGMAHGARGIVIVSDGAPWTGNTADRVFGTGNVTYIPDRFHVPETLRAAVRSMEPAEGERRHGRLKFPVRAGRAGPVIQELSRHARHHGEVAKRVGYFRGNIHGMRYGECQARGMPVGSGVIEGGCKSVIRGRMKKGGARWSMKGANSIMALRCRSLNNRMTDLFDWRRAA
ncbi:MAG: hypothetical protein OXD36_12290 [Rhodobacter sp.]|nr:hypothetical protein [Rhodobacter sp.]